jgi:TnpA family transposase
MQQIRFTLKEMRTQSLRRQVQSSLNNGEAVNSPSRALFFGRRGVMRERAFEDQMHRASCLVVLIAAIAAWNTVYLAKALET